jgi:hypothetical protein
MAVLSPMTTGLELTGKMPRNIVRVIGEAGTQTGGCRRWMSWRDTPLILQACETFLKNSPSSSKLSSRLTSLSWVIMITSFLD